MTGLLGFDWTLRIGDVLQVTAIFGSAFWAYHGIIVKLAVMTETIEEHTKTLEQHGNRMTRYEESLFRNVSDLQRIIGRLETADIKRLRPS